jgi:hypothetical protein
MDRLFLHCGALVPLAPKTCFPGASPLCIASPISFLTGLEVPAVLIAPFPPNPPSSRRPGLRNSRRAPLGLAYLTDAYRHSRSPPLLPLVNVDLIPALLESASSSEACGSAPRLESASFCSRPPVSPQGIVAPLHSFPFLCIAPSRELGSRSLLPSVVSSVAPASVLLDPPAVSRVWTFGSLLRGVAAALSDTLVPLGSVDGR